MKKWNQNQVDLFCNAAVSILSAIPSSFTEQVLLDKDGNEQKQVVEGRKDTPLRFAKMMMEMLEGELYTNDEIVELYKEKVFTQPTTHPLYCTWDDIHAFSFCEHHIALMYDIVINVQLDYDNIKDKNVKVIGLSKIPRICELVCKRLQLQERITADIEYIITKLLNLPVKVTVRGKHSCVSARGVKKDITFTSTINSNIEF